MRFDVFSYEVMLPYNLLVEALGYFGILSKPEEADRPYLDPKILAQKTDYEDHKWYKINPTRNFKDSGKKDVRAHDGGACDGNWFDPKFL